MSTEWTVRCVDCNKTGGAVAVNNSGLEDIRDLVEIADPLAELAKAKVRAKAAVQVRCGWAGFPGASSGDVDVVDLAFFLEHQGHRLVAHDEYGRDDGQCRSLVECTCGESHRCGLDEGHTGKCRRTERSKRRS